MFCYFHPVVNIHIVLDISGTTAHVLCCYSSASACGGDHVSSVAHTLPNEVIVSKLSQLYKSSLNSPGLRHFMECFQGNF